MKKKFNVLLLILTAGIVSIGLAQSEKWHSYNSVGDGQCVLNSYKDAVFDGAGNSFVVGINLVQYGGFCFRSPNIIVRKFSPTGAILATYEYDYNGLLEDDLAVSIKRENSTGNIFVLGYSHQFMILLKLNSSLVFQTEKRFYDFTPVTFGIGFGSLFVAGNNNDGAMVLRYKASNMKLVGYTLYDNGFVNDGGITPTGFSITGWVPTNNNGSALFVQSLDSVLIPVWSKTFNKYAGAFADEGKLLRVSNGSYYVGGSTQNGSGSNYGMVIKYNSTGTQQWVKMLANSPAANDYAALTDLTVDAYNEDVYVLGIKSQINRLYKYATSGTKLLDSTVTPPATGNGYFVSNLKSISNNGSASSPATLLFMAGMNTYQNLMLTYDERCVTYWTNTSGVYAYHDYKQPGGLDPSFGFTNGKVNKQVTPNLYTAFGTGRTEVSSPQSSGSIGIMFCYNITGPQPRMDYHDMSERILLEPNPAGETMTISSPYELKFYEITDLNGKVLQAEKAGPANAVVSLHSLAPGVYLIRIQDVTGIYTKKFVRE